MGMTIEEAKEHLSQYIGDNRVDYDDLDAIEVAIDTMRMYQQIQADYEARLKADLKAILVELQLEIEELKNKPHCCEHYVRGINNSSNVIQQIIDVL